MCIRDSLKSGAGKVPCTNTTGNFGYVHFDQYTVPNCSNGSNQEPRNIALGVDHALTLYTGTAVNEGCYTAGPNTASTETGNTANQFDSGMLTGGSFGNGRLAQFFNPGKDSSYYNNSATVNGVTASDAPLWAFIPDTNLSGIPDSCQRKRFKDLLAANPADDAGTLHQMSQCFLDYEGRASDPPPAGYTAGTGCNIERDSCTATLFGNSLGPVLKPVNPFDIQRSSRFAYVPNICNPAPCPAPGPGKTTIHFYSFAPIFLQTLYFQGGGAGSFDPGVQQSGTFGTLAASLSAWVMDRHMLPGSLGDPGAPFEQNVNVILELLR